MKFKSYINEQTDNKFDVRDIETETESNDNFRKVLFTGKYMQLVLMTLNPGEEIGSEIHSDTDQFFRIEQGEGEVDISGQKTSVKDGSSIIIVQGTKHNIINTSKDKKLKLYSLYSPPHHPPNTIHKTKEDALKGE